MNVESSIEKLRKCPSLIATYESLVAAPEFLLSNPGAVIRSIRTPAAENAVSVMMEFIPAGGGAGLVERPITVVSGLPVDVPVTNVALQSVSGGFAGH
jgi:hypothetical protein